MLVFSGGSHHTPVRSVIRLLEWKPAVSIATAGRAHQQAESGSLEPPRTVRLFTLLQSSFQYLLALSLGDPRFTCVTGSSPLDSL